MTEKDKLISILYLKRIFIRNQFYHPAAILRDMEKSLGLDLDGIELDLMEYKHYIYSLDIIDNKLYSQVGDFKDIRSNIIDNIINLRSERIDEILK